MSNKTNLINNFILLGLSMVAIVIVGVVSSNAISAIDFKMLYSVVVFVVLNSVLHELFHVIAGAINGFKIVSYRVLWFKWYSREGKVKFTLAPVGDQIGEAELLPTRYDDIEKRYKKVALAGIIANCVLFVVGIVCMFFWHLWTVDESVIWFRLTAFAMPVSLYFILANALPMTIDFYRNDGAVIYGILKKDDSTTVSFSLMKIQSMLYQGKTPSEIPEELYFDLPQLREDDPNFIMLLSARYSYYLDKGDLEKAKEVVTRLLTLKDYINKDMENQLQAEFLYSYSTFMYDENSADNIMEDYDKYLNKALTCPIMRAKLAYVTYVIKDVELAKEMLIATKQLTKDEITSGLAKYELKLIEKIEKDLA